MNLKQAVTQAWRAWQGYPANSGKTAVVYHFPNNPDEYHVTEFIDNTGTWHVVGSYQVLRLVSPRVYDGEHRRRYLLREALADAQDKLDEAQAFDALYR